MTPGAFANGKPELRSPPIISCPFLGWSPASLSLDAPSTSVRGRIGMAEVSLEDGSLKVIPLAQHRFSSNSPSAYLKSTKEGPFDVEMMHMKKVLIGGDSADSHPI